MRANPLVFDVVPDWSTPATAYPVGTHGTARIVRSYAKKGQMFHMNGVHGYTYYRTMGKMPVTSLQVLESSQWRTWMVDNPDHWLGTGELADRARPGSVLCGGLGLGLIVHALLARVQAGIGWFDRIVVVEKNPDVIELIRPMLPADACILIEEGDFWEFVEEQRRGVFSTIIVDLWRGEGKKLVGEMLARREWLEYRHPYPETLSLYFGFQGFIDQIRDLEKAGSDAFEQIPPEVWQRLALMTTD